MAQCRMQVVSVATTRIDGLVKEGRFLEALFYRLNVVQLEARTTRPSEPESTLRWRAGSLTSAQFIHNL